MSSPTLPTQLLTRPEGAVLRLQKSRLLVVRGPDKGKSMIVDRPVVTVGSGEGSDLLLTDPSVSRRQFELRVTADGYMIRDLGSTNGTAVDGLRVVEAYLRRSARLQCGQTEMKFAPLDEAVEIELSPRESFGDALGRSPAIRHVFAILERVAPMDVTVLLEGETGTGKEVMAEGLHKASRRAEGPFSVVDCGAIPPNLIESELFGHEKGSFTGAVETRSGAFEEADGGTLFLDEVGELPLDMQPKLLRALEMREIRRVGSQKTISLDLRIIAATNRDLAAQVRTGKFREDLYYRLAVVRVVMPPLRERREDIRLLARDFARKIRADADPVTWLDDSMVALLEAHDWPGNVRELRNVVERLAAFPGYSHDFLFEGRMLPPVTATSGLAGVSSPDGASKPGELSPHDLAAARLLVEQPYHEAKRRVLDSFERQYLEALLRSEQGVVSRAADRAGVPRQTFHRLIRKHGFRGD